MLEININIQHVIKQIHNINTGFKLVVEFTNHTINNHLQRDIGKSRQSALNLVIAVRKHEKLLKHILHTGQTAPHIFKRLSSGIIEFILYH